MNENLRMMVSMTHIKQAVRPIVVMGFGLLLAACSGDDAEPDAAVVATVGDAAITAEAFRTSYALGFPHLKRGEDPREAYLQHMIAEALLAQEGYRTGVDASDEVRRKVASQEEELLVEEVFEREVNARVEVTEDEVREAMARERVSFKLRYLPARTRAEAERLRRLASAEGFAAAAERRLADDAEGRLRLEDLESGYLTADQIDPALLEAVRDLPAGALSEPLPFRGSYLILEVVDIRREPLPPVDAAEHARYEQVLRAQKAKAEARRFIGEVMRPEELRVRREVYETLRRHLWAWVRAEQPEGNLYAALAEAEGPYVGPLRAAFPDTLLTTRDNAWTVEGFLKAYPAERYPLSPRSEDAFQSDLYDAFGLLVRDSVFAARARAAGWDEAPRVRDELRRWQDKWVYRAQLRAMADTVALAPADVRAYYDRHRDYYADDFEAVRERVLADARSARLQAQWPRLLDELCARYPVTIHHAVLDTLSVTDPTGRAEPSLMVFEGHTGRPAYPVVDPVW